MTSKKYFLTFRTNLSIIYILKNQKLTKKRIR